MFTWQTVRFSSTITCQSFKNFEVWMTDGNDIVDCPHVVSNCLLMIEAMTIRRSKLICCHQWIYCIRNASVTTKPRRTIPQCTLRTKNSLWHQLRFFKRLPRRNLYWSSVELILVGFLLNFNGSEWSRRLWVPFGTNNTVHLVPEGVNWLQTETTTPQVQIRTSCNGFHYNLSRTTGINLEQFMKALKEP